MITEHRFRNSGRTTRMMEAAIEAAKEGPVVVVFGDTREHYRFQDMIPDNLRQNFTFLDRSAPEVGTEGLFVIGAVGRRFFDHHFVYSRFGAAIEEWGRFLPDFQIGLRIEEETSP